MLYPTELRAAWWADLELNQDSRHYEYPALPLSYRPRLYCYVHYTATDPACQPLNSHTEPHPELIDIEPWLNPDIELIDPDWYWLILMRIDRDPDSVRTSRDAVYAVMCNARNPCSGA